MKNIFGVNTDAYKLKIISNKSDFCINKLNTLFKQYPKIDFSPNEENSFGNIHNVIAFIRKQDVDGLLDLAIKCCEPYLVSGRSTIDFSPTEEHQSDEHLIFNICTGIDDNNILHIFPKRLFYTSVKMWLLLSCLYSLSLFNGHRKTIAAIARQLDFTEEQCKQIESRLLGKRKNYWKRFDLIKTRGLTVESYYDLLIENGLLGKDFKRDGSIDYINTHDIAKARKGKTADNSPNQTETEERLPKPRTAESLPKCVFPSFKWKEGNEDIPNIDYLNGTQEFQLMTQYLLERVTNGNFAHYNKQIDAFVHDLSHLITKGDLSLSDELLNTLASYPLCRFRLSLLRSLQLLKLKSSLDYMQVEKICKSLQYQNITYFPLIEKFFHLVLKIRYDNHEWKEVLTEELNKVYIETPLFQRYSRLFVYGKDWEYDHKRINITISNGNCFTVIKNRIIHDNPNVKMLSIAGIINNPAPSFYDCLKDSFGKEFTFIKDIPEEVFAEFIKDVFDKFDGYIERDYNEINKEKSAIKRNKLIEKYNDDYRRKYIECKDRVFADYKLSVEKINISKFEDFVNKVCVKFEKDEYEYLFDYEKGSFKPKFVINRNKKLPGIPLRLLKEVVTKELNEQIPGIDNIKILQRDGESESKQEARRDFLTENRTSLKRIRAAFLRHRQYVDDIIAAINNFILIHGYESVGEYGDEKLIKPEIKEFKDCYLKILENSVKIVEQLSSNLKNLSEENYHQKRTKHNLYIHPKDRHRWIHQYYRLTRIYDYYCEQRNMLQRNSKEFKVINEKCIRASKLFKIECGNIPERNKLFVSLSNNKYTKDKEQLKMHFVKTRETDNKEYMEFIADFDARLSTELKLILSDLEEKYDNFYQLIFKKMHIDICSFNPYDMEKLMEALIQFNSLLI